MYIMCACLFSALSRGVGALQIPIIIIVKSIHKVNHFANMKQNTRAQTSDTKFSKS